jgi:hypothetical protein
MDYRSIGLIFTSVLCVVMGVERKLKASEKQEEKKQSRDK